MCWWRILDIARLFVNHHLRSAQVWHVFSTDLTVLPAHAHTFNLQSEWPVAAFAFPAIAGTHLPTLEGWKAELTWVVRQFTCPKAVTPIPLLTGLNVAQTHWSRSTHCHYTICLSVYLFSVSVIVLSTVVSCSIGRQLWWVFLSSSLPTVECNLTLILLRNVS